nr:unnamed protein product [Callosobruchus chinensis]
MERKMGPTTILTKEEEEEPVIWILNKVKLTFPLSGGYVENPNLGAMAKIQSLNRPANKWLTLFIVLRSSKGTLNLFLMHGLLAREKFNTKRGAMAKTQPFNRPTNKWLTLFIILRIVERNGKTISKSRATVIKQKLNDRRSKEKKIMKKNKKY